MGIVMTEVFSIVLVGYGIVFLTAGLVKLRETPMWVSALGALMLWGGAWLWSQA
jgi:hypothetical protein